MLWNLIQISWAQEGLISVGQEVRSDWLSDDRWEIASNTDFWLNPSVKNSDGTWNSLQQSDLFIQQIQVRHRLNNNFELHSAIPIVYAGSTEDWSISNLQFGAAKFLEVRNSSIILGSEVWLGRADASISWDGLMVRPYIDMLREGPRIGTQLMISTWVQDGIFPQVQLMIHRNNQNPNPLEFGLEHLWLPDAQWTSMVIKWGIWLQNVRFNTDIHIPVGTSVDIPGTQFGFRVSYFPARIDKNPDRDNDGIPNDDDYCTAYPEDEDGFEDEDGCPDPDNDFDGLPDLKDACPNFAEDFDDFEDDDGCPDMDNDQDNIIDSNDRCPSQPETINQYQDEDGCPDRGTGNDYDRDGVLDHNDGCPFHPEDINGTLDEDGCPEIDVLLQRE